MTYASLEESRASGQPVELYRFLGVIPPEPAPTLTDQMDYTSLTALDAVWTRTSTVPGATWGMVSDQVHLGSYAIQASISGTLLGGDNSHYITRTFTSGDGIVADTDYPVHVWVRKNNTSTLDKVTLRVTGAASDADLGSTANAWTQLSITGHSTMDAELTVSVGAFNLLPVFHGYDFWIDGLLEIELPPPPPATPTEYHYTSADVEVAFQGETYPPAIFTRSELEAGNGELSGSEVELTMPRDHAIALLFRDGLPTNPISCTIYRLHRPDVAAGTSYVTSFVGQVTQARFAGPSCTLTIASPRALLERKKPSVLCQRQCNWMLYDARCQLSKAAFAYTSTITAISGSTVTIDGLATDAGSDTTKYQYGVLVVPSGEQAFIERQDGDEITLLNAPLNMAVDDAVTVYQGCDRTPEVCHSRFNNLVHFGGMATMPQRNPFGPTGMIS